MFRPFFIAYTRCYVLYFAVRWAAKEKASVRFGCSWGKVLHIIIG